MSSLFTPTNHLISKRMSTSFSKGKQLNIRNKKNKQKSFEIKNDTLAMNLSMDVKTHMLKQRSYSNKHRNHNTLNFEQQFMKNKKRQNPFFNNIKKTSQFVNTQNINVIYGTSPNSLNRNGLAYSSQKSIKQRRKRLSITSNNKKDCFIFNSRQQQNCSTKTHQRINKTVQIQKQAIIVKYQKIKQFLKNQKYTQASIYLKQIIPHIQDKQKKKQLYHMFILSLMKCSSHNDRLEKIQTYILECLTEFPNFYQVYTCWAKIKIQMNQKYQAIQIYQKIISLNNKLPDPYIQLSNLFIALNKNQQAYKTLREGFQKSITSVTIPIKIIQNYKTFQLDLMNNLTGFIQRIQTIAGKKSTQYLYLLGFIQKQKGNQNQALIYFVQSLKFNTNKQIGTKSLQKVINIHINQRDFYAAHYDLKRSHHLNIDFKKIQKYEIFLEGVNFVMKKQNQEGIKLLTKIIQAVKKKQQNNSGSTLPQIQPSCKTSTIQFSSNSQLFSLTLKYLAYAHFKIGNFKESVSYYKMLQKNKSQFDSTTQYNMLLAEGVINANYQHNFALSVSKFQKAKKILNKIQPFIYHAMVLIQKKLYQHRNKNKFLYQIQIQQQLNSTLILALNQMAQGYKVNSSSSNLLFHRSIIYLFYFNYQEAFQDINACIQKAQQNLPKYFYIRGICYACMKNMKKAINQFSISISLNKQYSIAYLARAKSYFLIGQTQQGFQDLKIYIDQCPKDYNVHKWIGDLLFQGTSYNDCIKAYDEMGQNMSIQALCMKLKAQLKFSSIKSLQQTIKQIKNHKDYVQQKFQLDFCAFNLLFSLTDKKHSNKNSTSQTDKTKSFQSILKKIKTLNQLLQTQGQKGRIFNLVDCMNLIGIANYYIQQYNQAYEAFLLVLQFFKSVKSQSPQKSRTRQNKKQQDVKQVFNTEQQEQNLDLRQEDIYYNIFICFLASMNIQAARKIFDWEMLLLISNKTQKKVIQNIINFINQIQEPIKSQKKTGQIHALNATKSSFKNKNKKQSLNYILQPRLDTPINQNLRKSELTVQINKKSLSLKTSLIWSSYHSTNQNLYFSTMAKKLIYQFHAGYIDNMPQGPWIRRNQFGVLFTDNILDQGNQSSFITTNRFQQPKHTLTLDQQKQYMQYQKKRKYDDNYSLEQENYAQQEEQMYKNDFETTMVKKDKRKKAFLNQMRLDLDIQKKLNKIIKQPKNE